MEEISITKKKKRKVRISLLLLQLSSTEPLTQYIFFISIATCMFIVLAYYLSQHFVDGVSISEPDRVRYLPNQPKVRFNQFSGYISVDDVQQRQLFYYFVEAVPNPASKPIVLWLSGGKFGIVIVNFMLCI